jgi:lysophospholipase L1-like esterase
VAGAGGRTGRLAVSPRFRAALGNAALLVGAVVLVCLGLEAALRVSGFAPERARAVRRMVDARWTTLLDCFPSNPRGYFDIDLRRPEADALYRGLAPLRFDEMARRHPWAVACRYNALRFRDAPPGPRPSGVRRVVVLGDSFAEGQGVKEGDTLARALGRSLEARAAGRYEVRNCGRRGTDFPELLDAFADALRYEPDLVLYALTLNDAEQPPEFRARQSYVDDWILDRTSEGEADTAPSFFRPRAFDFVADRVGAFVAGRETTRWYLDMWGEANRAGRERTEEHLREIKRRLEARGARLLVAPWPLFVGLDVAYPFAPVHETIGRFCLTAGIAHRDLLPVFRGRTTSDLWVHPVDHHPNEVAHRLAAEALVDDVLKLAAP